MPCGYTFWVCSLTFWVVLVAGCLEHKVHFGISKDGGESSPGILEAPDAGENFADNIIENKETPDIPKCTPNAVWDPEIGCVSIGTKKWEYRTGAAIISSVAIGNDGTLYFGSDDYKLYALNPDGSQKWRFPTGGSVRSSPTIGIDGTIYVGSSDKKFYAIDPDGTKKWEFLTSGEIYSSAAIGLDNTIYFGCDNGNL